MKPYHVTAPVGIALFSLGLSSGNRLFTSGAISVFAYMAAATGVPVDASHPFEALDSMITDFNDGASEDELVILADGIALYTKDAIAGMDQVRASYFKKLYGTLDDTVKAFAPEAVAKLEHLPKVIVDIDKQIVILGIASTATHLSTLNGDSAEQFDDLDRQIELFVASSTATEIARLSEHIFAGVKGAVPAMSMFAAQRFKSVRTMLTEHVANKDDTAAVMGTLTESTSVVTPLNARIAELDTDGGQSGQLLDEDKRKVA